MVKPNRKEIIYVEDPHVESQTEQPKNPEEVEQLLDRGELTAVNVVSPTTLAGLQNPNAKEAVGERKQSTEAESIAISLNDL